MSSKTVLMVWRNINYTDEKDVTEAGRLCGLISQYKNILER